MLVQTRRLQADGIGTRAAVMKIRAEGIVNEVVPFPTSDDVVPAVRVNAFEVVTPAAARDEIVSVAAVGDVSPRPAEDVILALTPERGVATLAALEQIVPVPPEDAVFAISSAQGVVTAESPELIVATEATDHIPAVGTRQHIVSLGPPDRAWLPIRRGGNGDDRAEQDGS